MEQQYLGHKLLDHQDGLNKIKNTTNIFLIIAIILLIAINIFHFVRDTRIETRAKNKNYNLISDEENGWKIMNKWYYILNYFCLFCITIIVMFVFVRVSSIYNSLSE